MSFDLRFGRKELFYIHLMIYPLNPEEFSRLKALPSLKLPGPCDAK